ncbi:hypothetical protein [Arthrobacter globiformis]|uniref:hypothetical protein n=1 Tax=Arthrobacter globiformis TaxID=1665 RepID=UPI00277F06DA|nr:hypothetical protein [Arthrobacter globiformis]MDQ0863041.1 hypothetical protein [Arthrobacter globiformis]
MGKTGVLLATITTTALISGCHAFEAVCPAVGQVSGVAVTVAAGYSPQVKTLQLKACQDGRCKEDTLELVPGSVPVDLGCTDDSRPDGVCSATSKPDGTRRGMLNLDTLGDSPIDVTASGSYANGKPLPTRTLHFEPQASYPFGEQCGRFISASVVLDAAGLRQDR